MKINKKSLVSLLVLFGLWIAFGFFNQPAQNTSVSSQKQIVETTSNEQTSFQEIDEDWTGDTKEEVALYIHTYEQLPANYMTKRQAKKEYGWAGGPLHEYGQGLCIGGDRFTNYEGTLPEKSGRRYYECDIDTLHSDSRGPKRIVFSNDGLIYYTADHYETFELLYGDS